MMRGSTSPNAGGEGAIAMTDGHLLASDRGSVHTEKIDRLVSSAFGTRSIDARRTAGRLFRYGATSAVALGISEIALLIATASGVDATLSAVIGNLAGIVPSYLMSRYWIWAEAERHRVGHQVVQYWMTSLVSMTFTSLGTGAIASTAPSTGTIHLVVVGGGFLAINFVSWIGKYLIYQRFIFIGAARA